MRVLFEAPRGTKAYGAELLLDMTMDCVPRVGDSLLWNVDGDDEDDSVWKVGDVRWIIPRKGAKELEIVALVKLVPAELVEDPPGEQTHEDHR